MVILTIEQIEVDDIHTDGLAQCAVVRAGIQILAVQLCPIEQGTLLVSSFFIDLHLNNDLSAVHVQIQIKAAELLVILLRRKLHILDHDLRDSLAGNIAHIRDNSQFIITSTD